MDILRDAQRAGLAAIVSYLLVVVLPAPVSAAFTCSTVARRLNSDPAALQFTNKFASEVATNSSGDTLFVARPAKAPYSMYLYPSGGGDEIVATAGTLGPPGASFKTGKAFSSISLNDGGDLGFEARLAGGDDAVVVRESGGAMELGARTGDLAPTPGVFTSFRSVSGINNSSVVAFVAEVFGGASGVFVYDATTDTTAAAVLEGSLAIGVPPRSLCEISEASLGDSGSIAFVARTKLLCTDLLEPYLDGIFIAKVLVALPPIYVVTIETVALQGDPSPIPGTVYSEFSVLPSRHRNVPKVNVLDNVAFYAKVDGAVSQKGVFLWDSFLMTTSTVVATGDAAPDVGGFVKVINDFHLADDDTVFVNAKVAGSTAKTGIFEYGAPPSAGLVKTDAPPVDEFGPGSKFRKINKINDVSSDGSRVAVGVKVADSIKPTKKSGVINCVP